MGDRHSRSEEQAGTAYFSLATHFLFSFPDFWREASGGHGLDHAHLRCPVHIWRSQWLTLHLLPVSACPGHFWATFLCPLFCVYLMDLSVSRVLCYLLSGDFAGVCMSVGMLRGSAAHRVTSVVSRWQPACFGSRTVS